MLKKRAGARRRPARPRAARRSGRRRRRWGPARATTPRPSPWNGWKVALMNASAAPMASSASTAPMRRRQRPRPRRRWPSGAERPAPGRRGGDGGASVRRETAAATGAPASAVARPRRQRRGWLLPVARGAGGGRRGRLLPVPARAGGGRSGLVPVRAGAGGSDRGRLLPVAGGAGGFDRGRLLPVAGGVGGIGRRPLLPVLAGAVAAADDCGRSRATTLLPLTGRVVERGRRLPGRRRHPAWIGRRGGDGLRARRGCLAVRRLRARHGLLFASRLRSQRGLFVPGRLRARLVLLAGHRPLRRPVVVLGRGWCAAGTRGGRRVGVVRGRLGPAAGLARQRSGCLGLPGRRVRARGGRVERRRGRRVGFRGLGRRRPAALASGTASGPLGGRAGTLLRRALAR